MATHEMFDGRLQLYKRGSGRFWQCAARVGGERFRESTKEVDLDRAKDVAEEWYLDLRGKLRHGDIIKKERLFKEAAELYAKDVRVLTIGVRSVRYVEGLEQRLKKHVIPYFGAMPIASINKSTVQAYRVKRMEETIKRTATEEKPGKPPARSTMLQEIVIIRQVLKHAEGLGWIPFVPSLSTPYMTQGKKGRRAWFSPEEYEQLYKATGRRIVEGKRRGWTKEYEELHDYVLFMANSGLRPDEAAALEMRDVSVVNDYATKKTILEIDVRGKTGVGYCKTMPGAVFPFERLTARRTVELRDTGLSDEDIAKRLPRQRVFGPYRRDLFNKILKEEGLKTDRDGKPRTAYSLRHTYISMRLMEGANIHQIANNCRTSVQMIEEHYASHIKDRLDTSEINRERPRAARRAAKRSHKRRQENSGGEQLSA